ncbi:DUF1232 domain-containing protein [Myxococcota bacterium]|nr:DUF1232 domain-containing protein [Myxococcota bacterium]
MTDLELLQNLEAWVANLGEDTKILRKALDSDGISRDAKKYLLGGLSYMLRKVDIIPDYLGGIGVLDDAAVMRVSAKLAVEAGMPNAGEGIKKLISEDEMTRLLFDNLYDGFVSYVKRLPEERIRNRNADHILDEAGCMDQFDRELEDEIRGYTAKPLGQNDRTIREFRSFIKSKVR